MSEHTHDDGVRAYWNERAEENAAFYVDTSLDYEAPDMERFFETGRRVVEESLLDAPVQPKDHRRAIEIGSGLGRICLALRDHFDEVVGIDIAPAMVDQARQLVQRDGVSFQLGDGHSLAGVDDESTDFVVTFTVFQHQPTTDAIAAYVADAGRVLRPGGVLAAQWNNQPAAAYRRQTRKWRLLALLHRLPAQQRAQTAPQFSGTTATVDFMIYACRAAGLAVRGTSGEGTLFAWIWAQKSL